MRNSVLAALAAALLWTSLALLVLPAKQPVLASSPAPTPVSKTEVFPGAEVDSANLSPVLAPVPFDTGFFLSVLTEQGVQQLDLETYLTGVLLAEMPITFEEEALKAQAVACRTYTLTRCKHPRHDPAAVCADSGCCQGWRDPAEADDDARERAAEAVRATDGLVLLYAGELIDATFFSCSGGRTEDASAVWGGELPYLRAVDSPGEESASHYSDQVRVPLADFQATLATLDGNVRFDHSPVTWVASVQYTAGGGIARMVIGGCPFRGTTLRKAFALRSTAFTLSLNQEEAVFTTRGNGHRVGMSQYGANAMAQAGNDFETILKWYYQGIELIRADELEGTNRPAGLSAGLFKMILFGRIENPAILNSYFLILRLTPPAPRQS